MSVNLNKMKNNLTQIYFQLWLSSSSIHQRTILVFYTHDEICWLRTFSEFSFLKSPLISSWGHNISDTACTQIHVCSYSRTACTCFLGVMLDHPCMLFWQLEARTLHVRREDWNNDLKKTLSAHESTCKHEIYHLIRSSCVPGFNGQRVKAQSPRLLGLKKAPAHRNLFVCSYCDDVDAAVRFKSVCTSSSSLSGFSPCLSFHQAQYWRGRADRR